MTREQAVGFLLDHPVDYAHLLGFDKLTALHNDWIREMVSGQEDKTLQAHRGSYKTTCVSVALALIAILLPNCRTLFMRKTDTDTKEVMTQVSNILKHPTTRYFVQIIWNVDLVLVKDTSTEISTNLCRDVKGTSQLTSRGIKGSLTGKHFDLIFTDDIVNLEDRRSRAERDYTKAVYQELQNLVNRGGRIFNTGTPWHKEDAFTLMPNITRFDCYQTGLITKEKLADLRQRMEAALFAANYELKHIASDDVLFFEPVTGADPALVEQGIAHVDAAYGGADSTTFTITRKVNDKYYMLGKLWHKHVDDCEADIINLRKQYMASKIYCEDNGDKGYLCKELRAKGERVVRYHEDTNKYIKITSYLKAVWPDVIFVEGTDPEYINEICDYNENAEHDDAPDSAASSVRVLWSKKTSDNAYQSILR